MPNVLDRRRSSQNRQRRLSLHRLHSDTAREELTLAQQRVVQLREQLDEAIRARDQRVRYYVALGVFTTHIATWMRVSRPAIQMILRRGDDGY